MRFTRGNSRAAKLSNEGVFELRRLYFEEGVTQGELARQFGLSVNHIGRIVRGESRGAVPLDLPEEDHAATQKRLLALQDSLAASPSDEPILDKLRGDAQEVYDKTVKPLKELEDFKRDG